MLGVAAGKGGLEAGILVAPEGREVAGDLHGALAGGQDLDGQGLAASRQGGQGRHVVELLDAEGNKGVGGVDVVDARGAAPIYKNVIFSSLTLLKSLDA